MKPIEKKVTEHIQNELHFKMRNQVENHVEIKMWTELMDFLLQRKLQPRRDRGRGRPSQAHVRRL